MGFCIGCITAAAQCKNSKESLKKLKINFSKPDGSDPPDPLEPSNRYVPDHSEPDGH